MTVTTTRLGPDQARLRAIMRRLAEATSTDAPILSLYLDTRPEAHGGRPGERNELVVVRDRLDALRDTLELRSDARASFDADRARIEALLDSEELNQTDGVAIFACDRIGLWEPIGAQTAFDTQVSAGPTAELFQLARLLDDQVSAVIAVVDTNTCRLFVTRRGALIERPGPNEDPAEHTRHDTGGWSQARFQRHVDMQDKRFAKEAADAIDRLVERSGPDEETAEHRRHETGGWSQARFQRHVDMQDKRFAKEAAEAIDRLVEREKPAHVILAGDERAISFLDPELPERVRPLVDHVARIDMRATVEDVREEIVPLLGALEEADGMAAADRAIAGWRAGDLGVVGVDATMSALEIGQVDELIIDESVEADEELRAELIRQATATDARVEVVRDHPELADHEGVAATLRYRL